MSVLNKYVIIAHFHLMLRQNNFSEADLKEAVDLLHKELFPEVWAKINAKLEKEAAAATTAKPPHIGDKHYQLCKDIFEILSKHHLLVHEAYTVLEQVKSVIGYTPIR
ncbi:hypothetical protein [Anoxybacillus sp. EFIL]|uniref:hypothetical protein n=1 Tax=Anoxybacillus sp. EFIL TaxID=2508869 RepID=UPI00148E0A3C|nr:hypothetical protein [Anoxybacillus sp. EFIL]NNU96307.1 hypothetical protein [Anoxybacillus sp. EFIL]